MLEKYPPNLQSLALSLMEIPKMPDIGAHFPKTLRHLLVKVPATFEYTDKYSNYSASRYETFVTKTVASYPTYISDILLLPKLCRLKLCFTGLADSQKRKLVSRAIKLNMYSLSVVDCNTKVESSLIGSSKEEERLSEGIRQCNHTLHKKLMQVVLLNRRKHLRQMSTVFSSEMLNQAE